MAKRRDFTNKFGAKSVAEPSRVNLRSKALAEMSYGDLQVMVRDMILRGLHPWLEDNGSPFYVARTFYGDQRITIDGVPYAVIDEAYRMNEELDLRAACQDPRGSKTKQGRL